MALWCDHPKTVSDIVLFVLHTNGKVLTGMSRVSCAFPPPPLSAHPRAQEMQKRGISLTEGSFSAAISACGKSGQWERALSLLDEMEHHDLVPNGYCYNAAISGYRYYK